MTTALFLLPVHLRQRLAGALETGMLRPPHGPTAIAALLGQGEGCDEVAKAFDHLAEMGVTGPAASAWMRSVDAAAARAPRPDLVWSGPEMPGVYARNTRAVYEELLGSAERSIWASTYAYFDGPRAFETVARRMAERPNLDVTLLLNIQRKKGDTSAADQVVRRFADRFWGNDWPGERRPRVFHDPRATELDGELGVLHAKAVVADDEAVFITSANLTEAALDHNIEIGLHLRDRALAASLVGHFRSLIERGVLRLLPRG